MAACNYLFAINIKLRFYYFSCFQIRTGIDFIIIIYYMITAYTLDVFTRLKN